MTFRHSVGLALLVVLATWSAGCITFEKQSLTYEHRETEDRLLIYNVYLGIYGDDELRWNIHRGFLTEPEQVDLNETVEGRRLFLFDNGLDVIDLDEMKKALTFPVEDGLAPEELRAEQGRRELWAALLANMSFSNGPFFLNSDGRLCAVQRITVTNLSRVIRLTNIAMHLTAEAAASEDAEWPPEAVYVREWIAFEGNRLTVRGLAQLNPEDDWTSEIIQTRIFGTVDAPRVTITEHRDDAYRPNAIAFARTRFGVLTDFDLQADMERFFAGQPKPPADR